MVDALPKIRVTDPTSPRLSESMGDVRGIGMGKKDRDKENRNDGDDGMYTPCTFIWWVGMD
jgi:hypothetical protein